MPKKPEQAIQLKPKKSSQRYLDELGQSGLLQMAGVVQEEFLYQLRGYRWTRIVQEMLANDPIVHAMFFTVEMLTRRVSWDVKPGSDDNEDKQRAEFVKENLDDMSQSWKDTVSEILSYLPWGWSFHEVVYKARNGEVDDTFTGSDGKPQEVASSKFNDGRIGWRKVAIRAQESLERWEFDPKGGIQAMVQNTIFSRATIPIDKALLFRTSTHKNNPEGRSLCRRIYRPWYFKQKIENIEGIGIERDLAGMPMAKIPAAYLDANATDAQKTLLAEFKKVVTNIRRDEQEGLVVPSDCFPQTQVPMFEIKLLSTGGTRQFDTGKIINRYDQRILMTLMADFLLLGHEKVGSFALASSKTELFSVALGGFLDVITEVFNRHAIPKLMRLNGMPTENLPTLVHGDVETVDLKELGEFISKISDTKVTLDEDQQKWVLEQGGIPVVDGKPLPKKPEPPKPTDNQLNDEVSGKKPKNESAVQ